MTCVDLGPDTIITDQGSTLDRQIGSFYIVVLHNNDSKIRKKSPTSKYILKI